MPYGSTISFVEAHNVDSRISREAEMAKSASAHTAIRTMWMGAAGKPVGAPGVTRIISMGIALKDARAPSVIKTISQALMVNCVKALSVTKTMLLGAMGRHARAPSVTRTMSTQVAPKLARDRVAIRTISWGLIAKFAKEQDVNKIIKGPVYHPQQYSRKFQHQTLEAYLIRILVISSRGICRTAKVQRAINSTRARVVEDLPFSPVTSSSVAILPVFKASGSKEGHREASMMT